MRFCSYLVAIHRLFIATVLLVGVQSAAAQSLDDILDGSVELGESTTDAPKESGGAKSLSPPGSGGELFPGFRGIESGGPLKPSLGGLFGPTEPTAKIAATPVTAGVGDVVTISVTVQLPQGSHTYPIDGSSTATTLVLAPPPELEAIDEQFTADREPTYKKTATGDSVAQFVGSVTWSRRFRVVSAETSMVTVEGMLNYQVCDTLCKPYKQPLSVNVTLDAGTKNLAGGYSMPAVRGDKFDPASLTFELSPPSPQPGEEVVLAISLATESGWHVGALASGDRVKGPDTEIQLTQVSGLKPLDDAFRANQTPKSVTVAGVSHDQHEGQVVWQKRFEATGDAVVVVGELGYSLCKDDICLPRNTVPFSLGEAESGDALAAAIPLAGSIVDRSVFSTASMNAADDTGLLVKLGLAFLGGLILNVMPCVLPVLAIKVMGFVQQAGEHRGRILALNGVYSLGVIVVFLALGVCSITLGLGFGEQFQNQTFAMVMSTLVLVAALSLLGVFEIPIPGFMGSTGSTHAEGLSGAFLTGVMATVLATPCTGPFIGPLVAWAAAQPPEVAMGIWGMLGVGMASPYLLAGIFPKVIEFLPRPGMWMVYFKQVSGFILLGTVVFLMIPIDAEVRLHFLMAMVGVAMGCWVLGTFRPHESLHERWPVGVTALLLAGGISFGAYRLAQPSTNELPWEPFTSARLEELIASEQPVLVDFTADWCLICKNNEFTALNTEETNGFVRDNDVITLMADYTDESPEIKSWLEKFNQSGVPLTVVYPRGGGEPAVLRGPYTESTILEVLAEAVTEQVAGGPMSRFR